MIEPGEHVPNDYYIDNPDEAIAHTVFDEFVLVVRVIEPSCCDLVQVPVTDFLDAFLDPEGKRLFFGQRAEDIAMWVEIRDGEAVSIEQQYRP